MATATLSSEHTSLKDLKGAVSAGPKGQSFLVAAATDANFKAPAAQRALDANMTTDLGEGTKSMYAQKACTWEPFWNGPGQFSPSRDQGFYWWMNFRTGTLAAAWASAWNPGGYWGEGICQIKVKFCRAHRTRRTLHGCSWDDQEVFVKCKTCTDKTAHHTHCSHLWARAAAAAEIFAAGANQKYRLPCMVQLRL